MSRNNFEKHMADYRRGAVEAAQEKNTPPNPNTKEYKKEQLIQALVKELGSGRDREKRIRKVVNKYY